MRIFFLCLVFISSCISKQPDLSKQAVQDIISADKTMSDLAVKEGFHKALLQYSDDSVIKPNNGELPVIGKKNLEDRWNGKPDIKEISWEPIQAEASSSGDLGYTFGNWKYITKDTTLYGNYYTIWKKQKDGKWKFVIDGGNNTPAPAK